MLARVQEAKRQGKPLPQNIDDMERTVGGTVNAAAVCNICCATQTMLSSLRFGIREPFRSRIVTSLLHPCRYMAQLQATTGPRAATGASAGWQNAASCSAKQRCVLVWRCS